MKPLFCTIMILHISNNLKLYAAIIYSKFYYMR